MAGQAVESKKDKKIKHIIECAFGLFSEKGIDNVSMNDIAENAQIGVASLYRYFQTKEELAIETAIYAWNIEKTISEEVYKSQDFRNLNGYGQLSALLEVFVEAIISQKSFFSYIYYFDSFITKEKVSTAALNKYEKTIAGTNVLVMNAIEKGIEDGSVRFKYSENKEIAAASVSEVYFSMMHAIFCLAQKLSISGDLLQMDRIVEARKQMDILVNMLLVAIKG